MESVFGVSSCFLESLFMRLSFFYGTIFHIADEIKNIKGGRNMDTNYKYYKEITGELVRVHIEQDTTPENPRYILMFVLIFHPFFLKCSNLFY